MSVRRALVWSYAAQASMIGIQFSTTVVLARILTPYDFGVFAFATGISAIISIFASFNVGSYLIREPEITPSLLRSAATANMMFAMLLASALLIAGLVALHVVKEGQVGTILIVLALATVIATLEFIPTALLTRDMRFDFISKINVSRAIIVSATVIITALCGWRALSFGFGSLVGCIYSSTIYLVTNWKRMVFRPSFEHFRVIVLFGSQMMSIGGVAQLAARVSDLLLSWFLGLAALGLYSRASNISNLLFSNVYGAATSVIFTKISRDLRETGSFHTTFLNAISLITGVMWPVLIGIAILSGPMISILYGSQWVKAAAPLSMLMIAQFVALGFGMNWEVFVLKGETARQTRYEFLRALFGTAAFAAGAAVSITWAAVGRIVEASIGYGLYRPHMDRLVGTEPGELEKVYLTSFALTVAATWPALALMIWNRWDFRTSPFLIAAAIALGGLCWIAVLRLQGHPILDEVLRLVKRPAPRVQSEIAHE